MDLYKLRKSKNVTQDDVAQYLSITRQAYSRYERNEREPDINTLIKLADYFDITLDMLLNDDCCYFADKKLIDIPQDVLSLIDAISQLTDKECEEVSKFIDFVVSKREK